MVLQCMNKTIRSYPILSFRTSVVLNVEPFASILLQTKEHDVLFELDRNHVNDQRIEKNHLKFY